MDFQPLKYFDSLYPPETREKELKSLIPFIEKGLSSQIVGLPGSGKSNILRLLAYNRDARHHNYGEYEKMLHFVYLDCSEIKDKPLFDITKFILISLSFSLGERGLFEDSKKINDFLKEGIEMKDEMFLFQSLKQSLDYLAVEKKITIHLLFDKFDVLLPTITPQFFTNLRILRNHAKYRFASVFSLTRPLEESLDPMLFADFHDMVAENIVFIELYDKVGIDFRLSYIEKAARKKIPQELKNQLLHVTAGHAKLIKLSMEAIISEDSTPSNLEEFLLKRTTIQGALYEVWQSLQPSEQIALKNGLTFADAKATYPYLTNSGLLEEQGIAIPLLARFSTTVSVERHEKITYDEDRNELLLGNEPISDKLSPSEFKLLKYLVQNKEKLCTKDEIISAIWGEQKSLEGVTDQALDQIFYRLRKKVEQDPANPQHIQTIKGKGYKLVD